MERTATRGSAGSCVVGIAHAGLRSTLAVLVCREGYEVVGDAATAGETLTLVERHSPTLALVDERLALPLVAELVAALGADGSLLVHVGELSGGGVVRLLEGGARAIVLSAVPPIALVAALRAVQRGERYLDPALPARAP